MIYARGNRKDYDNWANLTGDHSWSYDNVLPFFKRSEGFQGRNFNPGDCKTADIWKFIYI